MDRARRRLASAIDGLKAQFTDADSEGTSSSDDSNAASTIAKIHAMVREQLESKGCRLSRVKRGLMLFSKQTSR